VTTPRIALAVLEEALEAAAVAVALHGRAYAPIFARMERAVAEARSEDDIVDRARRIADAARARRV
jgi:hypothetical protein